MPSDKLFFPDGADRCNVVSGVSETRRLTSAEAALLGETECVMRDFVKNFDNDSGPEVMSSFVCSVMFGKRGWRGLDGESELRDTRRAREVFDADTGLETGEIIGPIACTIILGGVSCLVGEILLFTEE